MDRRIRIAFLAALFATTGCGGKPKPEEPAPVPVTDGWDSGPGSRATPEGTSRVVSDTATDEALRRRAVLEERIYFDFDRADLSPAAKRALQMKAEILRQDHSVAIRIEGHADERGSDEYNLALGNRRAAAAKRYLVGQGIGGERLEVASFGEEQPVAMSHDESAWQANRRAEFRVSSGTVTTR